MPEGIIEKTRELIIKLPAMSTPGLKRAQVILGAGELSTHCLDVEWLVKSSLRITPSGLVIERDPNLSKKSLLVIADDHAFRIVQVTGPHLPISPALSSEARLSHRINLDFDLSGAKDREAFDIQIETDHPDQNVILFGVLILNDSNKRLENEH